MRGFKDRNRFTDSKKNHWFRGLLRHFRGDATRFEIAQGVRAASAMLAPVAIGLLFHDVRYAVVAMISAFFVLLADTGGAYRQKAAAMIFAGLGIASALIIAVWLNSF